MLPDKAQALRAAAGPEVDPKFLQFAILNFDPRTPFAWAHEYCRAMENK